MGRKRKDPADVSATRRRLALARWKMKTLAERREILAAATAASPRTKRILEG